MNIRPVLLMLTALAAVVSGCGGGSDNAVVSPPPAPQPTRGFAMGFTPWPYEASTNAINFVYPEIAARGDFIAHHLDSGIPWQEALDGTAYDPAVELEIASRLSRTANDQRSYLAISPFSVSRDGLAGYWSDATNQPLADPWDSRGFDSLEVIQAYTNFARDLIGRFQPDNFNLGIEASEIINNDLAQYDRFVTFAQQVASALRSEFPNLRLMISIGLKSPGSAAAALIETHIPRVVEHVDVVGASVYPFVLFDHADRGDPANLPTNWLAQIVPLARIWRDTGLFDESLNTRPALDVWQQQLSLAVR